MTIKRLLFTIICLLCPITISLFILSYGNNIATITKFLYIFIAVILWVLFIVLLRFNKIALAKLCLVVDIIGTIILCGFMYLSSKNMLSIFYSVNIFRDFILSTGSSGILIYIIVQAAQVVFLPVPAAVIAIAGSIIYGPLMGGVYCSIGVLLGSNLSYLLGRTFGYRLVSWIAGVGNAEKYSSILNNKGKLFLPMSFLLPMFPDDILCLISGMTKMNYSFFFFATTITRPIGVICMCFFGGGYVIPFDGWGIYVWILIALIMAIVVFCTYKYQEKIENWILSIIKPKKNKASN